VTDEPLSVVPLIVDTQQQCAERAGVAAFAFGPAADDHLFYSTNGLPIGRPVHA
jgi:hypothetical protein